MLIYNEVDGSIRIRRLLSFCGFQDATLKRPAVVADCGDLMKMQLLFTCEWIDKLHHFKRLTSVADKVWPRKVYLLALAIYVCGEVLTRIRS